MPWAGQRTTETGVRGRNWVGQTVLRPKAGVVDDNAAGVCRQVRALVELHEALDGAVRGIEPDGHGLGAFADGEVQPTQGVGVRCRGETEVEAQQSLDRGDRPLVDLP